MSAKTFNRPEYRYYIIFATFLLSLYACIKPEKHTIIGHWVINLAIYKRMTLIMTSKTLKVELLPAGFGGKMILKFEKDSTVEFPGIGSYDVPCTWSVRNDELKITLDSSRMMKAAFAQFDNIRTKSILKHDKKLIEVYKAKCDSILLSKDVVDIKNAANIYTGVYKIKIAKNGSILTITSPTTEFFLVNEDDVLTGRVHEILTVK
ncbi:MAG: hypothetical protein JWP94_3725 [Mucilaginibacter sp.]|nr:hypothetical protein [Mucilaginibacter sp.]